jgi:hypothetical protein
MIACLPRSGNLTVYLDVKALRASGILDMVAGSKSAEELEYQQFVEGTGFDYRSDVDALAAAFSGRNAWLVLRGSFNWKKIRDYVVSKGGTCRNTVCRIATAGDRYTSLVPLRNDFMAIAFNANNSAVLDITPRGVREGLQEPDKPIWISVAGPALRDADVVPTGAQSFVSPLESAENIVLSAGADGDQTQLDLNVLCGSESSASDLLVKLEGATNMLRKMLEREKQQPNPADLSGLLAGGVFRRDRRRVYGSWPLHREFLATLASGAVR